MKQTTPSVGLKAEDQTPPFLSDIQALRDHAERIAIESYGEIVRYLGTKDPTTRRLMEQILAKEEEHAEDLRTLSQTLSH